MSEHQTGAKNGMWKGGRSVASNGYVLIRVGKDHHLADSRGYAYEHKIMAELKLGLRLKPGEQVHHRDHNKTNNAAENIEVMQSAAHHRAEHRQSGSTLRLPDEPNPEVSCACGCGSAFLRFDDSGRPRQFVSGHNPPASPVVDAIVAILASGERHRSELADLVGSDIRATAVALSKLKRQGRVVNKAGVWSLRDA